VVEISDIPLSRLDMEPAELSKAAENREALYFETSTTLATLPRGKADVQVNGK